MWITQLLSHMSHTFFSNDSHIQTLEMQQQKTPEVWAELWSFSYMAMGDYEKTKKLHYSKALTFKNIPNQPWKLKKKISETPERQ